MNILLMPNLDKQDSVPCTNSTLEILAARGAVPLLEDRFRPIVQQPDLCVFGSFDQLLGQCDLLMPIGGDGTILHAVKHAVRVDKPLLGINTGRVGFLTQIEGWELDKLSLLLEHRYTVEQRMLLELLVSQSTGDAVYHALNDVNLTRESHRLMEIGVYQNEQLVVRHRADGLILATPTGSTGYSLSAGGSVVEPSLSVILMTAVCPYSAYNRSLILPPEYEYTVRLETEIAPEKLNILVDGEEVARVAPGHNVRVRRSQKCARLIDLGQRDFYSNLREKLSLRR